MSKELVGLHEATTGPSSHTCPGQLVDAMISRRRIILVCYRCSTYWHTGELESTIGNSVVALIKAADSLYQMPKYVRYRLSRQQREAETERWYTLYKRGWSLSQIAAKHEVTRQSVYEKLVRRGYKLRPTHPRLHEKIMFNGEAYTPGKRGYYRRTVEPRIPLHHAVWEAHHGPIPAGHQVGHVDGDVCNNDIGNLVCLPIDDMTRFHHAQQEVPETYCLSCGARLTRKRRPNGSVEGPAALLRRRYCDRQCARHRFVDDREAA